MTETVNPCPPGILPTCKPKDCGVEFCQWREAYESKKLAEVPGGWAEYANSLRQRAAERKEQSKTKKQRRDEANKGT